ncbi:MAG: hypothetical protein HY912_07855 [Desulfomonile tiedjei]|uniref:Uncharacterized protein n=1 Tax=Desulfomonile tiedjei TaxID=2358 RepID=A0A9D6V280_9BACT|nr:hypothetical protein [Desulfomonile tiedjei]
MAAKGKRISESDLSAVPDGIASNDVNSVDSAFADRIRKIAQTEFTPSSALELLAQLISEVPAASKETMEQIKMLDKLLNTARAMMETRLKNEEAAAIAGKLCQLEGWMKRIAAKRMSQQSRPREIWNDRMDN